jgi:membrane protein
MPRRLRRGAAAFLRSHPRLSAATTFLVTIGRQQSAERISLSAAAVAFWAVIAITPALIALAIIFGRIVSPADLAEAVDEIRSRTPGSLSDILATQLQIASESSTASASWGIVLSLITVLWAVSTGVYTFTRAVRVAYGLPPQRYFSARAIAFVAAVTLVLILGITLLVAAGLTAWASSLAFPLSTAILGAELVVGLAFFTLVLWLMFRVSTGHVPGRTYLPGAVFGAVGVVAVVIGYGVYLQFATSYQAIYGALASSVILSLVTYVATYAVLLGAVANAALRDEPATPLPPYAPDSASNSPA